MKKNIRRRDTALSKENETFASSVSAYSAAEYPNDEKDKRASILPELLMRFGVIAVCIGVLGYSVYMIANKLVSDYRAEAAYQDIRIEESDYVSVRHAIDLPEPKSMPTVLELLAADGEYEDYEPSDYVPQDQKAHYESIYRNYIKLSSSYPDMYAWIYMNNTKINYPVMKTDDNDFYLVHNYKGEDSDAGSIFADRYLNDNYYSNRNMIIYGHNMHGDLMFHTLKKWCISDKNKSYLKTTQIEIYTKDGVYIYDILGWYMDDHGEEFAKQNFHSETDFLDFIKTALKKAGRNKTGADYNAESRICTLITCATGAPNNATRYVVHGILNRFISFS